MTPDRSAGEWLSERARAGAVSTLVLFVLVAATASSRAAHGVLSPAALAAVVAGAAAAAAVTGWVTGIHEGAATALRDGLGPPPTGGPDELAGRAPWRRGVRWAAGAGLWAGAGAVLVAAVLQDRSAPVLVVLVALVVLAAPAAVVVELAARAVGLRTGALLRHHRPEREPLVRRAWTGVALPVGISQLVVNAGATWLLFQGSSAEGTLTRGEAFGDALVLAALLAALFGALSARWGDLDAAAGRVVVPPALVGRGGPVGPQALVYAALLTVAAASVVGLVVPSTPSLARVAVVRGLLAGLLAATAAALGYVRGACNASPLELGTRAGLPSAAPPAPSRRRALSLRPVAVGGVGAALLLVAAPLLASAPEARAQDLEGFGLVAELDAFGVRVEYDIPVPAGTGSAPQVVGTVRRSSGGEAANGVAASPTRFDPVVGGTVADPDKDRKGDENALPQAECAYPGDLVDTAFSFPTDMRPDLATVPPVGHAAARCGAGPTLELSAAATSSDAVAPGTGGGLSLGTGTALAEAGAVDGVLQASAAARVEDLSLLGGLIRVASVEAHGRSSTDGRAGGASTEAAVDVIGFRVAGTSFDLRGGDLVVAGTRLPVGSDAAGVVLDQVGAILAPLGCALTVLDDPGSYPQGFLFARPDPDLGVADDGSLAASMAGGLLLECDLPQDLTAPTGFNPQRIQVALGFAFTSVAASADIGGFGLDDLPTGDAGGAGPGLGSPPGPAAPLALPPAAAAAVDGAATDPTAPPASTTSGGDRGPVAALTERIELLAANFAADRPWVWVSALGVWLLLTHRGVERLRAELDGVA